MRARQPDREGYTVPDGIRLHSQRHRAGALAAYGEELNEFLEWWQCQAHCRTGRHRLFRRFLLARVFPAPRSVPPIEHPRSWGVATTPEVLGWTGRADELAYARATE